MIVNVVLAVTVGPVLSKIVTSMDLLPSLGKENNEEWKKQKAHSSTDSTDPNWLLSSHTREPELIGKVIVHLILHPNSSSIFYLHSDCSHADC